MSKKIIDFDKSLQRFLITWVDDNAKWRSCWAMKNSTDIKTWKTKNGAVRYCKKKGWAFKIRRLNNE